MSDFIGSLLPKLHYEISEKTKHIYANKGQINDFPITRNGNIEKFRSGA